MRDSYSPVLKLLGERKESDPHALTWIVIALVAIPLLLLLINTIRHRRLRRNQRHSGFDQLERLCSQNSLDYPEHALVERMAEVAGLQNPAVLVTSIDVFDRAAASWMRRAMKLPWLEMEAQVGRLASIRHKLEFRHVPPDRAPTSTRELQLGEKLYTLAAGEKELRLLSAQVVDLDDLAIRTEPFRIADQVANIRENREMWVFFWSQTGGEYRFKTRVLKKVTRPVPYLVMMHGDSLVTDKGRKVFSCDMDVEFTAGWLSSRDGRSIPSVSLFEDDEVCKSLAGSLTELSASGFSLRSETDLEECDLIRLEGNVPAFLNGKMGRIVEVTDKGVRCKFHKLSPEERERILAFVTPRIPPDIFSRVKRPTKASSRT